MHNSRVLLLILLALQAIPTFAEWTDQELAVLPAYCAAKMKHIPGEYEHWAEMLGPDFQHTHHYCDALASINRYYAARSAQDRTFNLTNALGGLNYMIAHASPSYSLMPEIYLNRGVVLSLMKKDGDALRDLLKALELDPKLIRGYTMVSDFYTKVKRRDEALKAVTDGLRHNAGNARLQHLYQELGGKLPYPDPIEPASEKSLPPAAANVEPSPAPTQAPASADKPAAAAEPSTPASPGAPAEPKIGTPSNPWCRFCPEPAQ